MDLQDSVASYMHAAGQWAWQDSKGCMSLTGPSSLTCGNIFDSQTSDYVIATLHLKSHIIIPQNAHYVTFKVYDCSETEVCDKDKILFCTTAGGSMPLSEFTSA